MNRNEKPGTIKYGRGNGILIQATKPMEINYGSYKKSTACFFASSAFWL